MEPPWLSLKHIGHCDGGHRHGSNLKQPTPSSCAAYCREAYGAGYMAYSGTTAGNVGDCACYTLAAGCPDDDKHDAYNAFRIYDPGACL